MDNCTQCLIDQLYSGMVRCSTCTQKIKQAREKDETADSSNDKHRKLRGGKIQRDTGLSN